MALAYGGANSHRTDCGTAAAANLSAGSFLVCFLPNPLTGGKSWIGKGTGAIGSGWNCFTRAGGSLQIARFQLQRATTDMQIDSAAGTIQTTGLQWLGVAWDVGAGSALMVHGTIAALMSDVSSGLIAGSGAQNDDSGNQFVVGNDPGNGSSWAGSIAYSIVWNRALSLADFRSQQFRPRVDSGCVHFMAHGYNGTSTQPDWSGNGNAGTVTGATVADHAPIPFRRTGALYAPYAVAAATGNRRRRVLLGAA